MDCKIIVNSQSGNCRSLNLGAVCKHFNSLGYRTEVAYVDGKTDWHCESHDAVVVCGGDGTLNLALRQKLPNMTYVPCGTLNEAAASQKIDSVGTLNGQPFAYVAATGSFTEIGYSAKTRDKQRFHRLAYLPEALKFYRSHEIEAEITCDGQKTAGKYTLIMFLRNNRCFGFRFNRQYEKRPATYMLAVKSFGKDAPLSRLKMFPTFFRIFFLGASKPVANDRWTLVPVNDVQIKFAERQNFCLDGEKYVAEKDVAVSQTKLERSIEILKFKK